MVACAIGAFAWWSAGRPGRERAEAIQAAKSGDFTRAEPGLQQAYERDRNDAEVIEILAREYLKADDLRAEQYLNRLIELSPDRPEPLQMRMEFYKKRVDGRAYADAVRLLELDPGNVQLRRTAMNQAFSYGYFAEAEEHCRACLRQQPGDTGLRVMLAEIRRSRGDPAGAAAVLDDVIRDNPKASGAMVSRAVLYNEAGEAEKAAALLREVFRNDPQRRRTSGTLLLVALERMGQADTEEGRKVKSEVSRLQNVELFRDALTTQPDNLDLRIRFATRLLADGHVKDGLEFLNSVLNQAPNYGPAHKVLADYYEKANQPDQAAVHRRLAGTP